MNLKPLGDHLIIQTTEVDTTTKSGIVLPETIDKEKPQQGEVIAVGPGRMSDDGKRLAMSVAVGQKVLFKKYAPDEIKIEDKEYLVLSESDVIAIVE